MSPSDIVSSAAISPARMPGTTLAPHRYLFGPLADFLCLGGSSLLILPLVALLPEETYRGPLAGLTMLLAMVINHPHFAHSYQIFYRRFANKAFGAEHSAVLRGRYIVAGIVVPVLLLAFIAWCLGHGDARLLGHGANLMGLLVGWHYVKQGYGMLMVDAALKRKFFPDEDKKVFLANGYAVWLLTWFTVNNTIREKAMWGLTYYTFGIPDWLVFAAGAVVVVTGSMTAVTLAKRWKANGGYLPYNGVMAYLMTLYGWMLFVHLSPLWIFVVPALHSLQYLVVVYRYETNYEKGKPDAAAAPRPALMHRLFAGRAQVRLAAFSLSGIVLGFLGFFGMPMVLQSTIGFDRAVFGPSLFVFLFWIFINVHHYFLDSVMWRRENPDTRRFLFS